MILETEYSTIQMGDIVSAPTFDENGVEIMKDTEIEGVIVADPPKGVKTSRKKKMNTSDIRFYDE